MRPTNGKLGQHRQVELRRRHDSLADEARTDQAGQADAENGQREPGRHLVDREPKRQHGEIIDISMPAATPHTAPISVEPVM